MCKRVSLPYFHPVGDRVCLVNASNIGAGAATAVMSNAWVHCFESISLSKLTTLL